MIATAVVTFLGTRVTEDRDAAASRQAAAPSAVDVGFAQDMTMHHQQAVVMAQIVRGRVPAQIADLAYGIESNQLLEIGQLQGFLSLWGKSLLPTGRPMSWMPSQAAAMAHGDHSMSGMSGMGMSTSSADAAMPGMATQAQLNQLQTMRGKALEVQFLQLMLRHHEGGMPMAVYASRHAAVPAVRAAAQRMAFDQTTEIARMQQMLQQLQARAS
jgi:uncharacterized protein (DUF305 family)